MTSETTATISDVIADRIRALRKREGLGRDELAAAARAAGLPVSFTAVALGNIETGRRDQAGRRRRDVTADELLALAAAAGCSPLELLGDHAAPFAAAQARCYRCEGAQGVLEQTVRADIAALDELAGIEPSLAATAVVLAQAIDGGAGEDGRDLTKLTKELRGTLEQLAAGRRGVVEPEDDDDLDGLDEPD